MYALSVNDLQEIAVRCATQFLTHDTPLNQSLAKEACDLSLNPEQLKRAIEATNSLVYLKNLEKSASDRTSEFKVADYNEIMRIVSLPADMSKEAETDADPVEATESIHFSVDFPELTTKEAMIGLRKEAALNDRLLEEAEGYSEVLVGQLLKAAAEVKQDPQAIDKLSAIDTDFEKVARLVFGEDKARANTVRGMFKEASLKKVENLAALYKQATDLMAEIQQRKEWQNQTNQVFEVEKQAAIAAIVGGIGRVIGNVGGTVVKAPFKGAAALARHSGKKAWNAAADTSVGKAMVMKKFPQSKMTKRVIGGGMILGGAALDASMYEPKQNPTTGNGGDIMKKING